MLHALELIEEMGPDLGLSINLAKCELFSPTIKSSYPSVVKSSCLPNVDILGAPIGDYLFCAHFIADVTDAAWQQAQLHVSLSFGGLGLRSLALHSSSAFLASFSASGVGNTNNLHCQQSLIIFNSQASHSDAVTIESVLADQPRQ